MKIEQKKFSCDKGWETLGPRGFDTDSCNLVMAFGSTLLLSNPFIYETIRRNYPNANILLNSTAGEICDTVVSDDSLSLIAIYFEKTRIKTAAVRIDEFKNSLDAGRLVAAAFDPKDLSNVLVISDGQKVNGSELVRGLQEYLPVGTIITGGLAGDGTSFKSTLVGLNELPIEGRIAAIGFYGHDLEVAYGSMGGWDSFGPERLVTKSKGNVLYELDGKGALDVYKMYLGEYAAELPGSGLLFPLSVRTDDFHDPVVRSILGVNEEEKSITFAGDISEGSYARLMKANFERLIDGASQAAQNSLLRTKHKPELALLISCVGRKLVLNQRVEEEVEVVRSVYGDHTAITGFYSYGEISPSFNHRKCELHNQSMTITTFSER